MVQVPQLRPRRQMLPPLPVYRTVVEKIARDEGKEGPVHKSKRARKNYLLFFEAKRDGENANFFGGLIQDEQWEPNWEEEQSAGKCRRNHWQRRLPCNE